MKKIGIFCGYFLPHLGGVERYVDKLSLSLQGLGYEIVIITSRHDPSLSEYEVKNGQSIYRLPLHRFFTNRYPILRRNAEYKSILNAIENEGIDFYIVNTRFYPISIMGAKMGNRLGCPVLLIEHGTSHFAIGNKLLDKIGSIYEHILTGNIKKNVNGFYGVSKKCNEWLMHFSIHAKGVFYNAVDIEDAAIKKDYFKNKYPTDEIIISYAGRLIKEKGVLNLIEAFEQIRSKNKNLKVRLVLAGDGDLFKTIKQRYDDPAIELLGALDFQYVMSLHKRSDIFVHPSLYPEGMPTSILEAGLMKCAVIATPKGGTEEIIKDGESGTIVDGTTESLYNALSKLLAKPSLRNKFAQNLNRRVKQDFNWSTVGKIVDKELESYT